MPPTLSQKGTFNFYKKANISSEYEKWLESDIAINIIIKILKIKLSKTGTKNRMYFLQGRTGSGKSTLMISSLFEHIIKFLHGKLICSEPRVVLTKANATDVIRYNDSYKFGKQMGVLSGVEKIICSEHDCMYYCTPQILSDMLLHIIQNRDKNESIHKLSAFRLIIVDEVHVLDNPMMALLKTIQDVINIYGEYSECPLFIFASATIDVEQMVSYYFPSSSSEIYSDPLMIGLVSGSSNYGVDEKFLTNEELKEFNIRETREGRNSCYKIIAEYFYNNYYNILDKSKSYIKLANGDNVQCRDVLFFVPLVVGIDMIGKSLQYMIKDRPIFIITKETRMNDLLKWRNENKNKKRVLYIGFARGYSSVSDELLSKPMETDIETLHNETRIIASTPIIETGKTITTLYLCIDMGLTTLSVYNPLSYNVNNSIQYLKQVPINQNQAIQRMGRVGREAPGLCVRFYSEELSKHFLSMDTAETINSGCLSPLILNHLKNFPLYTSFDIINENHYIYPTTIDILIKTAQDLISSGYLTVYGQLVNLRTSFKYSEPWILYAKYLYYILGFSLWDSLLLASINRKSLPSTLSVSDVNVTSLRYQLDDIVKIEKPNDEIIEGIQKARNVLTSIMYGKDNTFALIKNRIYDN